MNNKPPRSLCSSGFYFIYLFIVQIGLTLGRRICTGVFCVPHKNIHRFWLTWGWIRDQILVFFLISLLQWIKRNPISLFFSLFPFQRLVRIITNLYFSWEYPGDEKNTVHNYFIYIRLKKLILVSCSIWKRLPFLLWFYRCDSCIAHRKKRSTFLRRHGHLARPPHHTCGLR